MKTTGSESADEFASCSILGVQVADIDMSRLIAYTEKHLSELSGKYICAANVHTIVTASEQPAYMEAYRRAVLIIPDGGPLSSVGRRKGYKNMRRTTGPDYMQEMLSRGYRHFFYGSTAETLKKMRRVIGEKYPKAEIAGMISPPFRKLSTSEEYEVIRQLHDYQPDFVWVGLGAPKQELWMYRHEGKIPGLMVGVGAAFDYLAGNIHRAPKWMQRSNLEWLYRLKQEPGRLMKRYLSTNIRFLWKAVLRGG